jgi:hypothetical protein
MPEATSSSSALHQRQRDLEVRLRLLEAEAVDLEARRGQAVLAGGEPLAQLHQRVAEVEVEQADVAAAVGALEAPLARARERERQQETLRQAAVGLCRERLEAAAGIDHVLQVFEAHVVRWRSLGDALHPLRHEFGLLDALGMGTTLADDGEALARALWALAPTLAEATGFRPNDARRPLVQADGAGRLAQRLQQPQRAA